MDLEILETQLGLIGLSEANTNTRVLAEASLGGNPVGALARQVGIGDTKEQPGRGVGLARKAGIRAGGSLTGEAP
jgi:hypothetical protein